MRILALLLIILPICAFADEPAIRTVEMVEEHNPPGTLLTMTCQATWEYSDPQTDTQRTGTAQATCYMAVIQPQARLVAVSGYDRLQDGWYVIERGVRLRGGGLLTTDGRVLMPVGGNQ